MEKVIKKYLWTEKGWSIPNFWEKEIKFSCFLSFTEFRIKLGIDLRRKNAGFSLL